MPVESDHILMRELLEKVLKRRKLRQMKGLEYTLEKQSEPGIPVDLDNPLITMDTLEFCLVRENSECNRVWLKLCFCSSSDYCRFVFFL